MFEEKESILQVLGQLREQHEPLKQEFFGRTENHRTRYQHQIAQTRNRYLDSIFSRLSVSTSARDLRDLLLKEIKAYSERCDWNYIDPIILMSCFERVEDELIQQVAKRGVLYQAFRMIDDVLDDHLDYKGGYPTFHGNIKQMPEFSRRVQAVSLLPAVLMICEGLRCISDRYIDLAEKTVLGALSETIEHTALSLEDYTKIVEGKMVSYGLFLYGPILDVIADVDRKEMESFLRRSFLLSQVVNDIADQKNDRERDQPNFWTIHGDQRAAVKIFLNYFSELSYQCGLTPSRFQPYACIRLSDIASYAIQCINLRH